MKPRSRRDAEDSRSNQINPDSTAALSLHSTEILR